MRNSAYINFFIKKILVKRGGYIIFFIFLLSSCSEKVESEKLSAFFEELLLEYGGAYTLFSKKPMTIEALIDTSEEAFDQMEEYLDQHPELETIQIERKLEEGWKAWKNLSPKPISKNYILSEIQCEDCDLLVFVNVKNTVHVMNDHRDLFEEKMGRGFNPEKVIEELRKGKYEKWKEIFRDSTLIGILLGYGLENSVLFTRKMNGEKVISEGPSENNDPRLVAECYLNEKPFRIPIFSMLDRKKSLQLVRNYKKERKEIKELYKGKDFLEETLAHLQK